MTSVQTGTEETSTAANTSDDSAAPAAPTTPVAPDKSKSSVREYVVFEQRQQGWVEMKRVTASDVEGALNSLGVELKQTTKYVAVAERYWRPAQPKIETQTTISLNFDD